MHESTSKSKSESKSDVHISASQLKAFTACKLLWWHQYVGGIKPAPTKAVLRGIEIHRQLEQFAKHGTPIEDPVARTATVRDNGEYELPIEFSSVDPDLPPITGVIDAYYRGAEKPPVVVDYKTTKEEKFTLSSTDLHEEIQARIYGLWSLKQPENATHSRVFVAFQYLFTGAPKPRLWVHTQLTRVELELWEREWLIPTMREIEAVRDFADPAFGERPQDAPDSERCRAYGGCFFRAQCEVAMMDSSLGDLLEIEDESTEPEVAHEPTPVAKKPTVDIPINPPEKGIPIPPDRDKYDPLIVNLKGIGKSMELNFREYLSNGAELRVSDVKRELARDTREKGDDPNSTLLVKKEWIKAVRGLSDAKLHTILSTPSDPPIAEETPVLADQIAEETPAKADQIAEETPAKADQIAEETPAKAGSVDPLPDLILAIGCTTRNAIAWEIFTQRIFEVTRNGEREDFATSLEAALPDLIREYAVGGECVVSLLPYATGWAQSKPVIVPLAKQIFEGLKW